MKGWVNRITRREFEKIGNRIDLADDGKGNNESGT